jgi:hypothetical protein
MATITNFNDWLEQADPSGYEEVYALYRALEDCDASGIYSCIKSEKGDKWFFKGENTEDTLMLASPKAKDMFMKLIESKYGDGELDMESLYHLERNMAKDD